MEFLKSVDEEVGLGDVIVDLGSGPRSVSRNFADRARVEIDISKKRTNLRRALNLLEVAADLDELFDERGNPTEPTQTVLDFIKEINAENGSVIASDVLNYIDWKKLFSALDRILPDEWKVVINNRVNYGPEEALSDKRPGSLVEIQKFFENTLGYKLVRSGQLPPE